MGKKLYVGNLAFSATEDSLQNLFTQYGDVDSCRLIIDRDTGRSKGFAFVEMSSDEGAEKAISDLDGKEVEGRAIKVNEARPQPERSGGYDRSSSGGGFSSQSGSGFSGQRSGGGRRSY